VELVFEGGLASDLGNVGDANDGDDLELDIEGGLLAVGSAFGCGEVCEGSAEDGEDLRPGGNDLRSELLSKLLLGLEVLVSMPIFLATDFMVVDETAAAAHRVIWSPEWFGRLAFKLKYENIHYKLPFTQ